MILAILRCPRVFVLHHIVRVVQGGEVELFVRATRGREVRLPGDTVLHGRLDLGVARARRVIRMVMSVLYQVHYVTGATWYDR